MKHQLILLVLLLSGCVTAPLQNMESVSAVPCVKLTSAGHRKLSKAERLEWQITHSYMAPFFDSCEKPMQMAKYEWE